MKSIVDYEKMLDDASLHALYRSKGMVEACLNMTAAKHDKVFRAQLEERLALVQRKIAERERMYDARS